MYDFTKNLNLWNEDCIVGASKYIPAEVMDLIICDPPFGLEETKFNSLYKRDSSKVLNGYTEAPQDYFSFTLDWMEQVHRILKADGSFYVVIGFTNLPIILECANILNFKEVNHIIWKHCFGPNATRKFVSSHYHILYYTKLKAKPTFNTYCRFGPQEKDDKNKSLLYQDLEDVFVINKDNMPQEYKNLNKLPEELLQKLILYSSNPGDIICDFFMGNFTTAYAALKLGRKVVGFEINPISFIHHESKLKEIEFGCALETLKKVEIIKPQNQGKRITEQEKQDIYSDYFKLLEENVPKYKINKMLCQKYGRGRFSIKNILDKLKEDK